MARPKPAWYSRAPILTVLIALAGALAGDVRAQNASAPAARELRVCADPNNLPYTNDRLEGFENRIAALVADDLDATVRYTWMPQRRGFVRNTLNEYLCDVIIGVPSTFDMLLTTKPYYRSTYVFAYKPDAGIDIRSFDDDALRSLRIGVHLIGDDYTNSPPAHALANRGIIENVSGYTVFGNYADPNPPLDLMQALASGEIDVAIVWGPLAGYFARTTGIPLELVPVSPSIDLPFLPFVFDMSMGVRRTDDTLRIQLEEVLDRRAADIRAILDEFGIPVVGTRRTGTPRR